LAALPVVAHAQRQATIPVVGFLASATPRGYASYVAGFIQGLKESGFVDGQNVAIVNADRNPHFFGGT
jgi:putative tryptophan/tyrosine transport system substrate-binding protein